MSGPVVTRPEDVVNIALRRIGSKARITSIYEGSSAANVAIDIYAQTRDELLRAFDWDFAERNVLLTLLKQAPPMGYIPPHGWNPTQYPALPWMFSYAYPSDCLEVRALKPSPLFIPNFSPVYWRWSVENDQTYTPPQKVILCNVPNAVLTYTGQITNPLDWEADFTEAFAAMLGQRLSPSLTGLEAAKLESQDAAQQMAVAETERG